MMEIQKTIHTAGQTTTRERSDKATGSFDEVLSGTVAAKKQASGQQQTGNLQEIGTITRQTPTVSELLRKHEQLKGQTWDILSDNQNQYKNYKSILPGTKIYIDRTSGELSWSGAEQKQPTVMLQEAVVGTRATSSSPQQLESGLVVQETSLAQQSEPVSLGMISNETPTVSHLLRQDARFRNQTWDILGQAVNTDKPFHSMQVGSEVLLNPATMEISWQAGTDTRPSAPNAVAMAPTKNSLPMEPGNSANEPVADLSQAVQPYMGKSYQEINCYELLVNGLKQLDIPYGGRNGLYSRLTSMAVDRGMAANAYLNGEGIVEAAGSTVLSKNYEHVADWQKNAADLISEIEPLLNSGQILSFSTQTRGHTGIVSRQDERWTFINSGRLDNPVGERGLSKGVGEEILDKEIQNWFKLAHKNGEHLRVTLGELSQDKMRTASIIGTLPDNRI
ncbi:hypothetical protein [Desulfogranum marinum]|uniref:hypothetical protein n=1 Tax=Desulfogranum marinum TaxID=453220 RepID=UPI0029C981B6|nr:hypothetical protein [Desulfogranum marinum]